MSNLLFSIWGRRLAVWGSLAMGLAQVGCAHPLVVEPQVVVSSRAVYPPVYGQVYGRGHAHVPALGVAGALDLRREVGALHAAVPSDAGWGVAERNMATLTHTP
jgi:hypothetical protein